MAAQPHTFFLFSLLSSLAFSASSRSFSHSLSPSPNKTSTLNVTASLHHVHFSPVNDQLEASFHSPSPSPPPPSSLTLTLHPRDSLHNSAPTDYKSRLLTRLTRDAARVNLLQTRLQRGMKVKTHSTKTDLESPIISGSTQGSGEYFTRVGIGHPPRQLYVVIDTGSDVSWVQCQPCSLCYSQSDPIFDPNSSSSFFPLPCDSPQCKSLDISECRSENCLYEVSYGDGSYTVGDFATETLTFSDGAAVHSVALGCGHTNDGLFVGAAGLLGLGGGPISFPSQLNASSFSYCLVDRDSGSSSTLHFNSDSLHLPSPNSEPDSVSRDSEAVVSAPLVKNPQLDTFYYIGMTGIRVGGEAVVVPAAAFEIDGEGNGGVIIDSGTAVTRLGEEVYEALRERFRRGAEHLPAAEGVAIFDTCYDLRGRESVAVPEVELEFRGGERLGLPARNYMIPVDSEGTFCLAFAGTASSMSIVGNVQQQGIRVGFDRVNSEITFEPNKC